MSRSSVNKGQVFDIQISGVWTVDDVAEKTGYKKSYIQNLAKYKKIPTLPKKSKKAKNLFDPVEVANWLSRESNPRILVKHL